MVIHDPNIMRLAIDPLKDYAPLIVDPDRIKLLQFALELLQSVRWRYRQIVEPARRVDRFELTLGAAGHPRKLANPLIVE
jgi:hypothetical protein